MSHPNRIAALLLLASSLGFACGTPAAKAPLPQRPIDEGRAAKIIAESLQKEGLSASPPITITLGGKELKVDAPVEGKKFAIVYLSTNDIQALGDHPLAKKKKSAGDHLIVETGTTDQGLIHFVVLYCTDYQYDDVEGTGHEATVITAENKLDRDVRDFVMIARREHFE